jgi:dipeptidyl aminopeptidase/acylaminoacyl peptidase
LQIDADTPPTFIALAEEDASVHPDNSILFYQGLMKADVPAELHVFSQSGHGFAIREAVGSAVLWTKLCEVWLKGLGMIGR